MLIGISGCDEQAWQPYSMGDSNCVCFRQWTTITAAGAGVVFLTTFVEGHESPLCCRFLEPQPIFFSVMLAFVKEPTPVELQVAAL